MLWRSTWNFLKFWFIYHGMTFVEYFIKARCYKLWKTLILYKITKATPATCFLYQIVGNKAKGRISKRRQLENRPRQIFRKSEHFLQSDTHTYVSVSGGQKFLPFRKIWCGLFSRYLCFEIRPFALLQTKRYFYKL